MLLAVITAAVSAFVVAPTPAVAAYKSYTTYVSVLTPGWSTGKKVIDIRDGSTSSRGIAQLWRLNNNPQQYWTITEAGTYQGGNTQTYMKYELRRTGGLNLCLDKSMDNGDVNGASVYQYPCTGTYNQQWYYVPVAGSNWGYLVSRQDHRCLDVTDQSFSDGQRLQVWDCLGTWNQRWNIQP